MKHKVRKSLLIAGGTIVLVIVLIIVFISPIAKYLIEKYDERILGRQIELDWAYVNPFTGYVYLNNVNIYECDSDTIFLSCNGISANMSMHKLLSKTYEVEEITLHRPKGIVIQERRALNFDDIIDRFTPTEKDTTHKRKEPLRLSLLNMRIKDGEFYYYDKITPVYYFIKDVNIQCDGYRWDYDTMHFDFDFLPGIGTGTAKGKFALNISDVSYHLITDIKEFNLDIIGQYLKDLTNYGTFRAVLNAEVQAKGSFKDTRDITLSGKLAVNDLHFGKNPQEDYLAFDRLMLALQDISPKKHIYTCDSITLDHPVFKYERYDHLDNIQTIFGKGGSNVKEADAQKDNGRFNLVIEIAHYIKDLAQNFFDSPYKIGRFELNKGNIGYNDFAISEEFSTRLYPLYIFADSIDKNHKGGKIFFKSDIQPHGNANIVLTVNPTNDNDFDVETRLTKIPAAMFNPYLITYTSYPLNRGTIEFNSSLKIKDGRINSQNHLLIIDPKVTKRNKSNDVRWIPMPLIMALVRENGEVIDYQIPISGNLKNPHFHLHDVIIDLLKNILIKPVTIPYRVEVRNLEGEIEKMMSIKWPMRTAELRPSQERFIEEMAAFLKVNPQAAISISPQMFAFKEKEYILFFEAKKKYYLDFHRKQAFTKDDSLEVDRLSAKDVNFVHYLNLHVKDSLAFTVQEKCKEFVDTNYINKKYFELNKRRHDLFMSYFIAEGVQDRLKIGNEHDLVPYNGFSFYRVDYKGQFPPALVESYNMINDLNEEAPRKKFKNQRKKYRKLILDT